MPEQDLRRADRWPDSPLVTRERRAPAGRSPSILHECEPPVGDHFPKHTDLGQIAACRSHVRSLQPAIGRFVKEPSNPPSVERLHLVARRRIDNEIDIDFPPVISSHAATGTVNDILDAATGHPFSRQLPGRPNRREKARYVRDRRQVFEQTSPNLTQGVSESPNLPNGSNIIDHKPEYARSTDHRRTSPRIPAFLHEECARALRRAQTSPGIAALSAATPLIVPSSARATAKRCAAPRRTPRTTPPASSCGPGNISVEH
jgi:hypothetical protein